ncbi:MAG: DUF294 nucleotidyltransferase-like domain-containing protein [Ignavibacteria bacterium]
MFAFILFTLSFFAFIIPSFESSLLDGKREMICELTNSAWSILLDFNDKYESGLLSLEEAQRVAVERIKNLRYGEESKDYFWITDEHPNMVMHPYRPELDGTDLSDYSDPEGKKLFVEFVKVVKESGEGYVDYMWQWKDDSTKIVPKLSFVKEFNPWGWIIGTGIYIEDVTEEINNLTSSLIYVSLGILLLVGFILFYIGRQSLKIENERQTAEEGLRESESKYKALVEASTDGLVMILEGEFVYANFALLEMLGYDKLLSTNDLRKIIYREEYENLSGVEFFHNLLQQKKYEPQVEAQLITKDDTEADVILYTSEISFGEKSGYTVIVKDISASKKISEELGENKERFNTLINNINVGVFRSTLGKNSKFIEANAAALKIFGFTDKEELFDAKIIDLFRDKEEQQQFFEKLFSKGEIKNNVIQIKRKDGSYSMISVSAVLVKDNEGGNKFCDGIIEDITDRIRINEERENLIAELQTSLKFLHRPIEDFLRNIISCNMNIAIHEAAKIITKQKYSAALVQADNGEFIGIVTDHDLRKRVVAENYDINKPIYNVMSAPLVTIQSNAFVFEALMQMHENSTRHLAVKNNEGQILGIISSEDLLRIEMQSSAFLLREIEIAESVEELADVKVKLPRFIKTLVDSGAKTKNVTHIITSVFDAIVAKLITFAFNELGNPPAEFSFIALGSAGRKEQTLISDQDNAIIFENVDEKDFDNVKNYFDKLAQSVCYGLNECGYVFCKGEAMANNPRWTQPLDKWISYFHEWIANSSQQDLIDISIFFDFRHVYGNNELAEKLRVKLSELTDGQAGFFQHLTKNCLLHKPPVGMLGGLLLESKGNHAETFDIKLATMPLSDFARIYALKNNLYDTNTLERLHSLWEKGVINKNSYDEIVQAYNFLMQLRFKHQATQITEDNEFDNFINPKELTQIEIKTLKNTFSQIIGIQKRLGFDFSGEAL